MEVLEGARIVALHESVRSQFCYPSDDFRYRRCVNALEKFEAEGSVLALEAKAMLMLQRRKRPFEVRKCMAKLFELRSQRGELEAFREFETFMKSHVPEAVTDAVLASHGNQLFSDRAHVGVWVHVSRLIPQLEALGGKVFLNSGALLGVVREGKLLDHDDDIDLGFLLQANSLDEAVSSWRDLRLELFQLGLALVEDQPSGYAGAIILKSPKGFTVDLFPSWIVDGKVYVYPHTFGELDVADVLPLKTCNVTSLPVPARPEKMLALNYGASWREPNPYFVFPWRRARRRFAQFLKGVGEGRYKRVLTYGTFDLIHVGHQRLFKRLSLLADEVIVGCSTTEFNALKGKRSVLPYEQRVEMLEASKYVTKVIPENHWEQKRDDVVRCDADLFVMGDDWLGKFDDLSELCQVLYLPRTEDISTTKLRAEISCLAAE